MILCLCLGLPTPACALERVPVCLWDDPNAHVLQTGDASIRQSGKSPVTNFVSWPRASVTGRRRRSNIACHRLIHGSRGSVFSSCSSSSLHPLISHPCVRVCACCCGRHMFTDAQRSGCLRHSNTLRESTCSGKSPVRVSLAAGVRHHREFRAQTTRKSPAERSCPHPPPPQIKKTAVEEPAGVKRCPTASARTLSCELPAQIWTDRTLETAPNASQLERTNRLQQQAAKNTYQLVQGKRDETKVPRSKTVAAMIRRPVSHTKLRLSRWMIRCSAATRSAVATCSLARVRSPAIRACLFFLTHCGTDSVAIDSVTLGTQFHHIVSTHQNKHHITDLEELSADPAD